MSVQTIQQACTTITKTKLVKVALDLFWGEVKDLDPTEQVKYASIERAIAAPHLAADDMLG